RALCEQAADHFKKAIELQPDNFLAYANLMIPLHHISLYEILHGIDPQKSIQRAIEAGKKCASINPKYANAYNNLGTTYLNQSIYELQHGRNPEETLQKARESFQSALDIQTSAEPYGNRGCANLLLARWKMLQGMDASATLDLAVKDL